MKEIEIAYRNLSAAATEAADACRRYDAAAFRRWVHDGYGDMRGAKSAEQTYRAAKDHVERRWAELAQALGVI